MTTQLRGVKSGIGLAPVGVMHHRVTPLLLLAACVDVAPGSIATGEDEVRARLLNARRLFDPPRAGNAAGNPVYLQGRFGNQGNFELAVPASSTGLLYYWRDNDADMFWNGPDAVLSEAGHFDALGMIHSNYGNIEVIARRGDRLSFSFRDRDPVTPWHGPWDFAYGVDGVPGFVQSRFGQQGNFEVVVPSAGSGLLHYWRDNDAGMVWRGPVAFFQEWGHFDAVTLIHSNYGALEGIGRRGSELYFFYNDGAWRGPWRIGGGARGNPVLIQSRFGWQGNFELVVPAEGGGVDFYWRDNDHGMTWYGPYRLFPEYGLVDAVGFFQSNYGWPGNFEMVLRRGESLAFAYRVDRDPWQGPFTLSEPTDPRYAGGEDPPLLRRGYTEYLGSFSNHPIQNQTAIGMVGTDLGVAFEAAGGNLAFLFGDTWTPGGARQDQDSLASTTASTVDRWNAPQLSWALDSTGQFAAMNLLFIAGGGMNVPLDGIALFGRNYVFFNTDWHLLCGGPECPGAHGAIALGSMNGLDPAGLIFHYYKPTQRFSNLSMVPIGNYVYLFGASEPYRHGMVYLARVAAWSIEDANAWEYYRGVRDGVPIFGPGEGTAVPLFPTRDGAGELSVRMHRGDKLLMTYNAGDSAPLGRGIYLRTAESPWGPWSAPEMLIAPGEAYGRWMHQDPRFVGYDDGLGEYHRRDDWGGEYGPYLVPRWFTDEGNGEYGITYTLSTWNPYQSHLFRTRMSIDGRAIDPPARGADLPKTELINGDFSTWTTGGWTQLGGDFAIFPGPGGRPRLTTFGAAGDWTTGALFQDVWIDATTTQLSFLIHGGTAEVKLIWNHNGEVVRAVHARNDNTNELLVIWDVRDYRGESVRVLIEDQHTGPWGFIGVGEMRFE